MINNQKNSFNSLLFTLTLFVASSILFLIGFFPVSKNINSGEYHFDSIKAKTLDEYTLQPPLTKYDRIILMIIDAWRTDYPNNTNMPFAYTHCCNHLVIKVDIPTVTMPRLKSITTGTISNFIDIVLNLGHTTTLDESILHRLVEIDKKSVFAGDRTWIKLFPNKFLRAAVNTDSFFVNDFYEGDTNVTKFLNKELEYFDWHLMILHYLGLDHIGHVEGSHSQKIYGKLLEMDNIIKNISAKMDLRNLLILTGDHGMRNGGSHGGSDKEELYVPLMAFHKNCNNKKRSHFEYNQIDMSATLAVLLDVKIPYTSIGCLIPEMLERYSQEEQLYFFYYNALHLMEKLKSRLSLAEIKNEDYYSWYMNAKASHKKFISSHATSFLSYEEAKQNYIRLSKKVSELLSESLVEYNMPQITIALSLTTLCATNILMKVLFNIVPNSTETNHFLSQKKFMCFAIAICILFYVFFFDILAPHNLVSSVLVTCSIALIIYFAIDILKLLLLLVMPSSKYKPKVVLRLSVPTVLLSLFLGHTLSLASSSFIEEEHQTWYYFTPSLLIILTLQNFYVEVKSVWQKHKLISTLVNEFWRLRFICIVMLFLVGCRRLNQTGDKWRHLEDIGDVLSRSENHIFLTFTLLAGLLLLLILLFKYNSLLERIFCFIALFCVFLYRQMEHNSSIVLVPFWTSLICTFLRNYRSIFYKRKNNGYAVKGNLVELLKTNLTCCFLISALLHKPHNVILLPALMYTMEQSYHLCDNLHIKNKLAYSRCYVLVLKTVLTIFIANMFYFYQGNSNSLTTIDLNPGYIGLSSYNPIIVGLFITLNTYCAPINAFLYLMWHMFATQKNYLPVRQEKEQISNEQLLESTEEDLYLVYGLFTASTIMPVAVYWCFLVGFRNHLFIFSVFAPKAFYECFYLFVFYFNFIITNLYLRLFLK